MKEEILNINEKLSNIQNELKVPKAQKNTFGNYKYRSCEDILEEVKPICKKNKTVLALSDELKQIGDRYYVCASAVLQDIESIEKIIVTAYAREEETKKGMDGSQITGTASSYARKYALNGLFNIDDTKDADTDEYTKRTEEDTTKEEQGKKLKLTEELKKKILDSESDFEKVFETYKVKSTTDMTISQLEDAIKICNKKIENKN